MRQKDHDLVLDGMRGIAALSVLTYHLGHWLGIPGLAANSGLAVDFFFCLSGYVLALVYARRLDRGLGLAAFMRARLVRLMPLIVLATVISAVFALVRLIVKHEPVSLVDVFTALALGLVNLPYLTAPASIGGPQVFPLNGPQYSLFLEMVVNAFWGAARALRRIDVSSAIVVVALLGVLLTGPGGDERATFWSGFPRVFASFYLGVLAHRFGDAIRARFGTSWWIGAVLMAGVFLWPSPLPMSVVMLWIAVLSPMVVAMSAGAAMPERLKPAASMLGELSFPIYALHYPVFCWFNGVFQMATHRQVAALEAPALFVLVPVLAWVALRLVDEPVRDLLSRRRSLIS